MTMHIEGPWLSTTGRKPGKRKFRNADQARQSRQLKDDWQQLLDRHGAAQPNKSRRSREFTPIKPSSLPNLQNYRGANQPKPASLPFTGEACVRAADKVYTGDKIKGIGTMHKSNAVPIFSDSEARDIASMRR